MVAIRCRRVAALVALGTALGACSSPEAGRVRGGGPGADPRNVGETVYMHGGARPYWATPCRISAGAPCDEPERLHTAAR